MPKFDENNKKQPPEKLINNYDLVNAIHSIGRSSQTSIPSMTASDKSTLTYLAGFLQSGLDVFDPSNRVNPKMETIAAALGICERAAVQRIKRLRDAGWIWSIEKNHPIDASEEVRQTSNHYYFSPAIMYTAEVSVLTRALKQAHISDESAETLVHLENKIESSVKKTLDELAASKERNTGWSRKNGKQGVAAKISKRCDEIARKIMDAGGSDKCPDNLVQLFKTESQKLAELKLKTPENQPKRETDFTQGVKQASPNGCRYIHPAGETGFTLNTHLKYPLEVPTLNKSHCEKPKTAARKSLAPEVSEILNKLDSLDIFSRFSNALGQKQEVPSARKQFAKSIAKNQKLDETLSLVESNLALLESIPPLQAPREDGKNHSLGRLLSEKIKHVADAIEAKIKHDLAQRHKSLNGPGKGRIIIEYAVKIGWCPVLTHKWLTNKIEDPAKIQACVDAVLAEMNPRLDKPAVANTQKSLSNVQITEKISCHDRDTSYPEMDSDHDSEVSDSDKKIDCFEGLDEIEISTIQKQTKEKKCENANPNAAASDSPRREEKPERATSKLEPRKPQVSEKSVPETSSDQTPDPESPQVLGWIRDLVDHFATHEPYNLPMLKTMTPRMAKQPALAYRYYKKYCLCA